MTAVLLACIVMGQSSETKVVVWDTGSSTPADLRERAGWSEIPLDKKDGEYLKPRWFGSGFDKLDLTRDRWNSALEFRGPVVLYPVNRVQETPLDRFTVVDIVRNSLGAGPCEYLLDLEGQKNEFKGRATCAVRDALEKIYANGLQKQKRSEIEKILVDVMAFVTHLRGRIDLYVEFDHKMREYLAQQRDVHADLKGFLDEKVAVVAEEIRAMTREMLRNPAHHESAHH